MRQFRIHPRRVLIPAIVASGLAASMSAAAAGPVPENVGGGLRQLIEAQGNAAAPEAQAAMRMLEPRMMRDSEKRVLVNIWLNGDRSMEQVRRAVTALGAAVQAELPNHQKGVMSAWVPAEHAAQVARLLGVRSVTLEHKPLKHLGKATAQGFFTTHADQLQAIGLTGQGVTIGALSDSYDKAPNAVTTIHAAQDIKSGDLPGKGNPFGDKQPVVVLDDLPPAVATGTDEGRAILQILYDTAPDAKLCFATAFTGLVQFAVNILKLADPNGPCKANVIDDDVSYSNEPFFSDGVVALAVDQVKADGVAYLSSAGNNNNGNFTATFKPISDADARSKFAGPLLLSGVDPGLTAGGFHNFGTSKDVAIALPIFAPANTPSGFHRMFLQWDDPFFGNTPSASYDFLVFDQDGNYRPDLSGVDNVYSTSQPVQGIVLPQGNAGTLYYLAIALRPGGSPQPAPHLQILDFDDGAQVTYLKFAQPQAPSVVGHSAARGAISVAADFWDFTVGTESFSSLGPTAIYLDQDNVPLARPEIRHKPDIGAPDGVDTTFFIGAPGIPGDHNPQFFGTSAAGPQAAAVGALLIQAAGGPGHISPDSLKTLLQQTTLQPHELTSGIVTANLSNGTDRLKVTVIGTSPLDPNQFQFAFSGPAGDSVQSIVMDGTASNIVFGANHDQFFVGATNIPVTDIAYVNSNGLSPVAQIDFLHQGFRNGGSVHLGIDTDNVLLGFNGVNSSLLFGAQVTATIQSGKTTKTLTGVLGTQTGRGYSIADGFGLIDGFAAYQKLKGVTAAR